MNFPKRYFAHSSVLITGGTGSLGCALIEEFMRPEYRFRRVISFARRWQDQEVLRKRYVNTAFRSYVGDVRDLDRLKIAFRDVDYVIHAAAIKSVVDCQYSPMEAVNTNVLGTWNVLRAAIDCSVRRVLFVSTDKSVNPINLYGNTKAVAEQLVVAGNSYTPQNTAFACVRYGNVFGSSGSVVPLFREQIAAGGPLTVTDPSMTRFWITMPLAVGFVVNALCSMQGGDVFIPKLKSSTIGDLCLAMNTGNLPVDIVGKRPGDKKHELMISMEESTRVYDMGWAYRLGTEKGFKFWSSRLDARGDPYLGFVTRGYSSFDAERMTIDEIKEMLK